MDKNITVLLMARTSSSRCPRKVIRPFDGERSLFEILCQKLKDINYPVAVGVGEPELLDIVRRYQVPVFERSLDEINAHTPLSKVFKCVAQCRTSHTMIISPCTPFLEAATINRACREFCASPDWTAMSSVIKEQNWFFDENRKPFFPIDVHNMVSNDLCIYALANTFEVFPVERFMTEGLYYTFQTPGDPYLFEIPKKEAFDIDTTEDFELGKYMWAFKNSPSPRNQ